MRREQRIGKQEDLLSGELYAVPHPAAIWPRNRHQHPSIPTHYNHCSHYTYINIRTRMSTAGPSRLQSSLPPPAPSTSGDSESTVPIPMDKGLDVGILRELAKSALVESLNDVRHMPVAVDMAHDT